MNDVMSRSLTEEEEGWVLKLLSFEFLGRDELLTQVESLRVVGMHQNDKKSILVEPDKTKSLRYTHERRVPVTIEGRIGEDLISILLHQEQGFFHEIEVIDWTRKLQTTTISVSNFGKCDEESNLTSRST